MPANSCKQMTPSASKPCVHYIPGESNFAGFCTQPGQFRCIEAIKAKAPRLSHSSVNTWLRCRRRWYIEYIKGVARKPTMQSVALKMGTVWDKVKQAAYSEGAWKVSTGIGIILDMAPDLALEEKDQLKLRALVRALGVLDYQPEKCEVDVKATYYYNKANAEMFVSGKLDAMPLDKPYYYEVKLSGRPDWYTQITNIESQVGTYFLFDERFEFVVMDITRVPDLRQLKGKSDESEFAYEERTYDDILRRPSFYFLGWNNEKKRYGRPFYRREFDIIDVEKRYRVISQELKQAFVDDAIYANPTACLTPFECDFKPICSTGGVSDILFRERTKEEIEEANSAEGEN
jgi:hypothetical protein